MDKILPVQPKNMVNTCQDLIHTHKICELKHSGKQQETPLTSQLNTPGWSSVDSDMSVRTPRRERVSETSMENRILQAHVFQWNDYLRCKIIEISICIQNINLLPYTNLLIYTYYSKLIRLHDYSSIEYAATKSAKIRYMINLKEGRQRDGSLPGGLECNQRGEGHLQEHNQHLRSRSSTLKLLINPYDSWKSSSSVVLFLSTAR